jgi:ubiquinone/menaquinone biosynthesis C-methylase UbiE
MARKTNAGGDGMSTNKKIENMPSYGQTDSDSDKHYYDASEGTLEENIPPFALAIERYYRKYKKLIENHFQPRQNIRVLEVGAGTCCLSLMLSDLSCVSEVVCLDISVNRMREFVPVSARVISAKPEKLSFAQGDMGDCLNFDNGSFDLIVFDASLHHTRSMWRTLAECYRVLAPDGLVVAQREQYLGLLTAWKKLEQLVASEEVKNGVSENAYLKAQYQYYFRAAGFYTQLMPVAENLLQKLLLPFNGLIYSKWVLVAQKTRF